MTTDFLSRLNSGDVLVAEGATGTNLQAVGLPPGTPSDEWVIDRPDAIASLHRAFLDAGCDIIMTCTFSANRIRFRSSRYADRVSEINRKAAQFAREIADDAGREVYVGGAMGPTGELLEPLGSARAQDVTDAYAEQAAALAEGGVDFLILETFFAIEEARAAIDGVKSASDLPLVCSFSYDRGTRTMMGVSPTAMVEALGDLGLAAIGANCGTTPENMGLVVKELTAATTLPVWAKPNAGVPSGDPPSYDVDPAHLALHSVQFVADGACVVGGCCGTTPEHLKAIVERLGALR